jgi:hypothetical protein
MGRGAGAEPEPEPEVEPVRAPTKKELKALEKKRKQEEQQAAKEAKKKEKEAKKRAKRGGADIPEPEPEPEPQSDLEEPVPEEDGGSGSSSDEEAVVAAGDASVTESDSEPDSDSDDTASEQEGEEVNSGDDDEDGGEGEAEEEDAEDPVAKQIRVTGLQVLELVKDRGNAVAVETLLRKLGDVSLQADVANFQADAGAQLPLHIAARAKHSQLCASLLTYGADIDRGPPVCRYTPLQLACLPPYEPPWDVAPTLNSVDLPIEFCARTILEHGADVNAVDQMGLTAIQLAIKGLVDYNQKRQEQWVERLRQEQEALALQAAEDARRAKAREKQRQKELQRRKRVFAEMQTKKKVRKSEATIKADAATKIQTRFRARQARKQYIGKRQDVAATKLQKVQRGRSSRKLLLKTHSVHMARLQTVRHEHKMKMTRVMKQEFGQCVIDVVRCLLSYKVRIDVEDDDYNTLLHLAAQTGDTFGPTLISMLLKRDAPSQTKNRKGLTPLELAIAMDHGACALALKPEEPQLSVLEQIERAKGYYEEAPTEFQVTELSPFVKSLGDLLYCRPWPDAYRAMLDRDQPQRANEILPAEAPVEFLADADTTRRAWEPPFEIRDRAALAALLSATSPRLRKPPPGSDIPLATRQRMAPTKDVDSERWMKNMMELLFEHKTVEVFKGGNGSVTVHGYGLPSQGGHVGTLNVNVDEVWVYRYRAQRGQPPPGLEDVEEELEEDDGIETVMLPGASPEAKDGEDKGIDKDQPADGKESDGSEDGDEAPSRDARDERKAGERPSSAYPIDIKNADRVQGMREVKKGSEAQVTAVGAIGVAGLITGHKDGSVRLWVKGKQSATEEGVRLGRHDGEVTSLVVVGRHAFTGSIDGSVRHWNTFKGICVGVLPGHIEGVTAMCVADDKAASPEPTILAVAARDGGIRMWIVDREDYACLCVIFCPQANTLITTICFDPDTPCLYATGSVTDKKGRETSVMICFSIAKFLRMHMLMPTPPTKPAMRRITAPPPEPEPEIEGMEDSDDEMDIKAAKKQAKKEQKEKDAQQKQMESDLNEGMDTGRGKQASMVHQRHREDYLADLLKDCEDAEVVTKEEAHEILDRIDRVEDNTEFTEQVELMIEHYEPKLTEFEEENPDFSRQHSIENKQSDNDTLAVLEDTGDPEDTDPEDPRSNDELGMAAIMAMEGENDKKQSFSDKLLGRKPSAQDDEAALRELSKHLGMDPRRVARMHAPREEKVVHARKDKTIDIVRTEINPLKGQRLPFVAAGYRLLIPGCLYAYTIEVKNGGGQFSWLSIEDPQEPFTEFLMCEPAGCNVRIATIVKTDGRKSFSVVWKVGVPANESKKLTVIVRALTRPIYTERLEACHVLFRGEKKITAMLWIETGPVLGFQDGSVISFGAYIPPKDNLSRVPWDEIAPKAVTLAKRLASISVGRSRVMRCKKCLKCLICCWNPLRWRCCKRRNALEKIFPQERYMSSDVDTELLRSMRGGQGQGAYKNVDRRLLMGFKRSARLRDGNREVEDESLEHTVGEPIECMWYNKQDRELFFGIRDVVSSIDVTARMNPWASPSQVLPAEDYMTDLAVVGSDIKGLLNVHGDDDLLVTSEDGTVRRLFLVKKDSGALAKLWTQHVVEKLTGLQAWLDEKLGHITPGGKKEKDLALDLKCINGKMYSVRHDGEVVRWAPDFQLMQWKRHSADLLPEHIETKIKHTAVGGVNVVKFVLDDEFAPPRTEIRATMRIGAIHLFMLICESPLKMHSDVEAEKAGKHNDDGNDSDYSYYSYSEDEAGDDAVVAIPPTGADGEGADGEGQGSYDPVHTPADSILLWNANTGRPIPLEQVADGEQPRLGEHPRGNICCATIAAGFIIIGRDCGNLTAYNLEVSGEGKEELTAAQDFKGHEGNAIDFVRTMGKLDGDVSSEMYCSRVLVYSSSSTLVLVHEIKSGATIFKFDLGKDDGKVRDFDAVRLSLPHDTKTSGQVHDHFVGAVGRDVHVWTLEGNIEDLVRYELSGGDTDDEDLEKDDDSDHENEDEEEEEQEPDLVFEMAADKPVGEQKPVQVEGPPPPKKEERRVHIYNGHTKPITCMQVRGEYAFTGCVQGSIRVWRCVAPWSNLLVLNATEGPVSRLLVPDLSTIWVAYGGFIRSWDLRAVHADVARQKEIATRPKSVEALKAKKSMALSLAGGVEDEEHDDMPEVEIHSSSTGASTTILPVGHTGIPTVRSLEAVPEVISEGKKLRQTYKVYASCVDGSVYALTPVRKEPIYTTQSHVAKERFQGSIIAAIMCLIEYVHLIGISFTVKDAFWPPALSSAYGFFGSFFGTMASFTDDGWSGSFWSALIFGGMFLGAMVAQISTNLLTREEFAWKFGGSTGGVVVVTHFACIALRVVDFFVGVVLFITISRPLLTTFVCGGNGATTEQEAQCWAMGHLTYCAIAAPALYVYVMMSWRIQRAYGNCGLFASRSLADLFRTDRDNVHDSRVHHLINFPKYCDASM